MRRRFISLAGGLGLALALSAAASAQTPPPAPPVAPPRAAVADPVVDPNSRVTTGQAPVVGGNAAGARERALEDAIRQAVDLTINDLVDPQARAVDVQYQSNGGAVIRMEVRFADWLEDPEAPTTTLSVRDAHLTAAPRAVVGGQEISLGAATYRVGSPPAEAGARTARVDHSGRLVLDGGGELAAKLAHGVALIYVQKVLR